MIKHLNIKIYGLVQGIFFRATAKEEAESSGITGFAKNLPDGSVYIEAEGNEEKLDKFIDWVKTGPPLAKIAKVEVKEDKLKNFSGFSVL